MGSGVDSLQLLDAHFGIDGRGFEFRMTQQLLDEADISSAFEHMGGATVTQ